MFILRAALVSFVYLLHIACSLGQEVSKGNTDDRTSVSITCPSSKPMSCKDVKSQDDRKIAVMFDGLEVLCDTKTDGGGWTVIQRRVNGSLDFYRGWSSYKYGFGTLKGEFWLGLEHVHRITCKRCYELRIDMRYQRKDYNAKYSYIKVLGEEKKYMLDIGNYFGNAGDSLGHHRNKPFTTKDNDNDDFGENCAVVYTGAWWYTNCLRSNLNGLWQSKEYAKGLAWQALTDFHDSVSFSEMKIRPCQ